MAALTVIDLGRREYAEMVALQERLAELRLEGSVGDLLLLLEHPPTYTLGRRSEPSDLLHDSGWYEERGIAICETPRGGKVTYHGPGQLVAYPIVDLRGVGAQPSGADRVDVAGFVAALEQSMSGALAEWGLATGRIEGLTGLWVDDDRPDRADFEGADAASAAPGLARGSIRKIGSIGLKIRRGVSTHGLSINVSCNLDPFDWINSCGIEACRATSIAAELGEEGPSVAAVGAAVAGRLADGLGLKTTEGRAAEIDLTEAQRVDSVA
ncbi:MAG: lipoyl(octanoyl) transferase LipB [Solirubrobacterales bacterium]|nr:lipoyl(octanoyl) transferase LipB [Solirubrobacterales bacterium]MCB0860396.1 lipoyl(octanoyl) transferase LipB [Solirubrobacterales bacterium]HRV60359.1 lipoyl(octanoyl) transferase LipB [Solirubrobacterales bacterium]